MKNEIKDKVIVITGVSTGIGEAIALLLSQKGAKVVLGARRGEQLHMLANCIKTEVGEAIFAVTDVKKYEDMNRLINLLLKNMGGLMFL